MKIRKIEKLISKIKKELVVFVLHNILNLYMDKDISKLKRHEKLKIEKNV